MATTTKGKTTTLVTSPGKVTLLAVNTPLSNEKFQKDPTKVKLEYITKLIYKNDDTAVLDGATLSLKDALISIEGEGMGRMSKVRDNKDGTFTVAFKSKYQPKVVIGSGITSRLLTAEEITSELGRFNAKTDNAEASILATVWYNPDKSKANSINLSAVNIISSEITEKATGGTQTVDLFSKALAALKS